MVTKSRTWFRLIALVVLLAALAVPTLVFAGGWAVVTLDQLPGSVVAGQPYKLGFMVRQHGIRPMQSNEILIEARQADTGQRLSFSAKPDQREGHYQAELLFPQPGVWEWGIQSGLFPSLQPMPALEVATVAVGAPAEKPVGASGVFRTLGQPGSLYGIFALLALVAAVVLIARSSRKRSSLLAGAGLIILCAGLAFGFFSTVNAQARQAKRISPVGPDAQTGQKLFLAKGCVVCHVNTRAINTPEEVSLEVGPNLSAYRNDPDYLKKFLANPQGVKPTSKMPKLGLAPAEIDALVQFINDGKTN